MNNNPIRGCPVCERTKNRLLFHQSFAALSEKSLMKGYDLVVCQSCGAGYADDLPEQATFDRYYAEMSKYEDSQPSGHQSEGDLQRFRAVADQVFPYLSKDDRLFDIGCATGGLLAEFKSRGFSNLLGVDPSPACARLTEKIHGIPAKTSTITTLEKLGETVDVVFLTGVLEHLRDIDSSLSCVKSCLRSGGFIYIAVPDATRYDRHFSGPFQFFSMEHVNYFSPVSLSNLMSRHGFEEVFTQRFERQFSATSVEPTIGAFFRLSPADQTEIRLVTDLETEPALERYIEQSRTLEQRIQHKITRLVDEARPLAVWGVGTHTLRLLETSSLAQARIVAFIDSNVHYQGKTLQGIPVVGPAAFTDRNAEILISSQVAEEEIFQTITEKLHWPNQVHRLYVD